MNNIRFKPKSPQMLARMEALTQATLNALRAAGRARAEAAAKGLAWNVEGVKR